MTALLVILSMGGFTLIVSDLCGSSDHFYAISGSLWLYFVYMVEIYSVWPTSVFLNWVNFVTWDICKCLETFLLSQFWREVNAAGVVHGGQKCCSSSHTQLRIVWFKISVRLRLRNLSIYKLKIQ